LIEKKKKYDLKIWDRKNCGVVISDQKCNGLKREKSHQFFFINLENIFFTNKTIPKLVNESGNVVTDQNQILQEAKIYYENLYSKRDTVSNINLKNEIPYTDIPTLSDEIKDNLEGEITYAELTASIKRM
jgi:hypothetical protein